MSKLDQVGQLTDVLGARRENIVYVVSAFKGVTKTLYQAMDALSGTDYSEDDVARALQPVQKIHEEVTDKFFHNGNSEAPRDAYMANARILRQSLMTHKQTSRVLMPVAEAFQIRDQVIGFGEDMSAKFLDLFLRQQGKKSHVYERPSVDAKVLDEGSVTDRRIHESKRRGIIRALREDGVNPEVVRILGGHMPGTPHGIVPHQGRGYSDIMGVDSSLALSDLGEYVRATRFWKVVDGVYTTNPNLLSRKDGLVLHPDISNAEALECASAGSGLINISALSLAQQYGLDLQIRNIDRLDPDYGTDIITGAVDTRHLFKVIVSNPHVDALTITCPEMAHRSGFGAAIMQKLSEYDLSVDQIGTGGTSITFSIPLPPDAADQDEYRERIRNCVKDLKELNVRGERFTVSNIEWDKERYVAISLVGREMNGRSGVFAEVASTISSSGTNFIMVGHGKSQMRISFLIDHADEAKVVQLLHDVYVRNDKKVIRMVDRRMSARRKELRGTFSRK